MAARSTFEPPRAGAMGGIWNLWYAFLRRTRLRVPRLPFRIQSHGITCQGLAVTFVPIYGWFLVRQRLWALGATSVYVAGLVTAILCLGWSSAGWAGGTMITLHGLGIADYFYSGKLRPPPERRRARYAIVIVLVGLVYSFVGRAALGTFVIPLQTESDVVLVNPRSRPIEPRRGEVIAYRMGSWGAGHFMLRDGTYLGRVIGLPGEMIEFGPITFSVNGESQPRRLAMPRQGKFIIPPDRMMVWPIGLHREFDYEKEAFDFAQRATLLPDSAFVGRPYKRWFLRKQSP